MSTDSGENADNRPARPTPLSVEYDGISADLKDRETWLLWRYNFDTDRNEWTKVPINPHTGEFGSATDPDSWGTFETVKSAHEQSQIESDGLGYVFDESDTIVGVDLDDARGKNGVPSESAKDIIKSLDSFTEVSPSGTGYHIYLHGMLPSDAKNRDGKIEIYQTDRFFTVTGQHVAETPESVNYRNDKLQDVHGTYVADDDSTDGRDMAGDSDVRETDLSDTELIETAKNAENGKQFKRLWNGGTAGYNSHSEADLALCNHLAFYTGNDKSRIDSLFRKSGLCREKWTERRDYRDSTIQKAIDATGETYNPEGSSAETGTANAENSITEKFITACERYQIDSSKVGTIAVDGEKQFIGVHGIVSGLNIPEAVFKFKREASQLSGEEKQAVIGHAVLLDLQDNGEFFKTPAGELYYFSDDERQVYRVDEGGRKILTDDFRNFAHEQYNLFAGKFSRNLGKDVKGQAQRGAPERDVYRLSHYDESAGELYINDFENGYYAVTAESIEWRSNGTDVFFLPNERAESYDYLSPSERPSLPDKVPGERPLWCGSGDALMRLFGNRVNYDETAALGPSEQRKQLYLHLHTLPFIDVLNARPIMAWIGEKGSGKTVLQRSIGRFIYGTDFTESIMPDSKDDFLAKVTNQPLAFLDNYDDGVDWANDILAAIATGAGIDKRELYTTNSLHREVPRCWLSLTSRDPPFRRDDVADRTLVFRVERVESGFIGMGDYLQQITAYRNLLWSEYLDNLQAVIREYHERDTASMSSDHRMADWAIFAKIIGDALGVNDVSTLLETMETERSTFALENEDWANVCSHWLQDSPTVAGEWHSAGELVDLLTSYAEKNDLPMGINHAAGLGGKLSSYRNEMQELYDLEIDDSGRSNKYRFDTGKGHSPSNLQSY